MSAHNDPLFMARNTPGPALKDWEHGANIERMRSYRFDRVQEQLRARDLAGIILFGGVNVRYATGTRFAQIFNLHSPFRCAWVPANGKIVMFDWERLHDEDHLPDIIGEVRDALVFTYFPAGDRAGDVAAEWAAQLSELIKRDGGSNKRVAIDICEPIAMLALQHHGIEIVSGEEVVERACAIKNQDELVLITQTIAIAESGLARIREELKAGITEVELWAHLHFENIRHGGEWIEYRLAGSGGRTNPWGQEVSDRMIGPWGYGADMSRTFFCKPGRPSDEQKRLYTTAWENIQFNRGLVKAGVSFEELSKNAWPMPDEFWDQRYSMAFHGMGMGDEWPSIPYARDWDRVGYDGELEEGMVITVESYIGAVGGLEGVKLEEMVLVTRDGHQLLTTFPFEEELLN